MAEALSPERIRAGLDRAAYAHQIGELLRLYRVDLVIDVGAHVGEFGKVLRGVGYAGEIVSFEPVAESFELLTEEMAANPPWKGERLALGDAEGEREIEVFAGDSSWSSLTTPTPETIAGFPQLAESRRETVNVRRLDDLPAARLLPELAERRAFLKVDVQGFESEVLAGAQRTLGDVVAVQVEASVRPLYEGVRPHEEIVAELRAAGFELARLHPVSQDAELRMLEVDCLMVRARSSS